MTQHPELLPCRQCGNDAGLDSAWELGWYVTCSFCDMQTLEAPTETAAITAWNKRQGSE